MKKLTKTLLASAIALGMSWSTAYAYTLTNLEVDHMSNPQAIDREQPRFSWQMKADEGETNLAQEFYQIVVTDSKGKIVWDSKRVKDGRSVDWSYAGSKLKAGETYNWRVTVWDSKGVKKQDSSTFTVGLNPDRIGEDGWSGAQWIGADFKTLPLDAQSLTVFRIACDIQIAQGSSRAGILFGGNDQRLMNANQNTSGNAAAKDKSYVRVELDGSNPSAVALKVYRSGYVLDDGMDKFIGEVAIPADVINASNLHAKHHIDIESVYGVLNFSVDGKFLEAPNVDPWSKGINANPYGVSGGSTAYPVVGDLGFALDAGQQATFSNFTVRNFRTPQANLYEELSAVNLSGGANGLRQLKDPSHDAMPMLRREFNLKKNPASAKLYVAARGMYELSLNGQRVGEDFFAPGFTQYNKTQLYQAYDVTNLLQKGDNAIGAQLAEGWWSGAITFQGQNWNYYGDRQSLLLKLVVTYKDGSQEVITSQPDEWKVLTDGALKLGSIYQGQTYDAIRAQELEGWDNVGFNDSAWTAAKVIPLEGTTAPGKWHEFLTDRDYNQDFSNINLVAQNGSEVKEAEILTAQSLTEVRPGVYLYDMGQNFAGVPRLLVTNGRKGQKITLRFAEVLYPDGPLKGMIMIENLRAAMVRDLFTLRGGTEIIEPHFTWHGYRYIEISGLDNPLPLSSVQGVVLSSIPQDTAAYETSNAAVNRLEQNVRWSAKANFFAIPTDCPQRNERMGWSGDLAVFANTAVYLANSDNFLRQHMQTLRDLQADDGRFTDTAPMGVGAGGFIWGSVGVVVPWELYLQYGDTATLAEHYDAMAAYMDYMAACQTSDGLLNEPKGLPGLGDWLSPQFGQSEAQPLWNAYEVNNLYIMMKTAEILGKSADASKWRKRYESRRAHYAKRFFDAEGYALKSDGSRMDLQTAYAVPLALYNVVDSSKAKVLSQRLADTVKRSGNVDDKGVQRPAYSLMTGFIGTAAISHALSNNGYENEAYRLLTNDQYPSWLYPVNNGATTIWERLDSFTKENGFGGNNSMNSFNHYSFGAVGAWMFDSSLGIARDENNPGFKHFYLKPMPDFDGDMNFARGHYDSVYGRIESGWERMNKGWYRYKFTVPANTTATVILPIIKGCKVLQNGKPINYDGKLTIGSGSYTFDVITVD